MMIDASVPRNQKIKKEKEQKSRLFPAFLMKNLEKFQKTGHNQQ